MIVDFKKYRLHHRIAGLVLALLLTICPAARGAQQHWRSYDATDGLPGGTIRAIIQDDSGGLWVGTQGGGVTYFDGITWTTYTKRDGLAGNLVSAMVRDDEGVLWIGTEGGLNRYDGSTWTTLNTSHGLAHNDVKSLLQGRDGTLWIGTANGMSHYNGTDWTKIDTTQGLADNDVRALVQDQDGILWIGTTRGVSRYDGERWTTFTTRDGLANDTVRSMLVDSANQIWVGTDSWVSRYDGLNWTKFSILDGVVDYEINTILQSDDGKIWVGTRDGIGIYDGERWTSFTAKDGLIHNTVTASFQDREGFYWFGATGGISRYSGTAWTTYTVADGLANNDVRSVAQDRNGVFWFGTAEGVSRFDGRRWQTVMRLDGLASNLVSSVLLDRVGELWFGTNGGVSRFDGNRWTNFTTRNGLIDNGVRSLYQDREGDLWFGTNGGVSRFNGETWSSLTTVDGLISSGVNAVAEDTNGHYWFGTDRGASRYDGAEWESFTTTNGLAHNTVRAIQPDSSRGLWFATPGGASRYENTLWRSFRNADGIADNFTWSALTDRSGHVWVGTWNAGVSRYDGAAFQTLTRLDGLAGNRVQDVFQDRDDNIWFATSDGVTRYQPPPVVSPTVIIDAVVTDDRYAGVSTLDVASTIGLVTFEFRGISLKTRPDLLVYRYRLRGFDREWRNTRLRSVDYSDLPRGDYTFEVQAVDRDLVYSTTPAELALQVHLPYERIGWISALIVAFILIAWQTGRVVSRDQKLQYVNKALVGTNRSLEKANYSLEMKSVDLEQVNSALAIANGKIQEADRLKSQFLANMSHELRTPMNAIQGFTRLVLRRAGAVLADREKDNLSKVQDSAKHLLELINEILDLSKIEAGRLDVNPSHFTVRRLVSSACATVNPLVKSGVTLQHEVAGNIDEAHTDETLLQRILINLLSNAVKFTEHGSVNVHVTLDRDDILCVAVTDTGIGIPPEALDHVFEEFRQVDGTTSRKYGGTGLGLSITKKLSNLLGGDIFLESEVNRGSTFTVKIPLVLEDPSEDTHPAVPHTAEQPVRTQSEPGQPKPAEETPDESTIPAAPILVIDDNPLTVRQLRQELGDSGYRVIHATDAVDGFLKAREHKPFAIALDIMMSDKDGWTAIALLKADPLTRDIPVVVLSFVNNRAMGTLMGVSDYLVKPVDRDSLLSALGRLNTRNVKSVHIIDDEANDRSMLCQLLEEEEFNVTASASGKEGIAALKVGVPDIIILDLMMPEMDGFAVLEHLNENPEWRDIPVIVVTAKDLTSQERAYLHERTEGIIPKTGLDQMSIAQVVQKTVDDHSEGKTNP